MTDDASKLAQSRSRALYLSPIFLLAIIALLAFSTRLLPIAISSYPFNNDSLAECAIASDIINAGHIEYDQSRFYYGTHTSLTVVYQVLLAFVASAVGANPVSIAQVTTAILTVGSVCTGYLISIEISRQRKRALAGAMFLSLFGTLVFFTGSAWKMSLGFALLALVAYAYMKRRDFSMFSLEIIALGIIVFTHHVAALIALLFLSFLTAWSVSVAIWRKTFAQNHLLDIAILCPLAALAFSYYWFNSLDRLLIVTDIFGAFAFVMAVVLVGVAMVLALSRRKHSPRSFAPIPATLVFGAFAIDYFFPLFPYSRISPPYVLVLGIAFGVCVYLAWIGFEDIVESKSRFRAIPLGLVLPSLTLVLFGVFLGMSSSSHQIIYRTFDFAGLGIAVGISTGLWRFRKRSTAEMILVSCFLVALIVSFPFAYATGTLVGVRHDTQQYEVDTMEWLRENLPVDYSVRSDERLSYIAEAISDFEKKPYLPLMLTKETVPVTENTFLILEEEWINVGVSDYPRGYFIYEEAHIGQILDYSNVVYIGGPSSNSAIAFAISDLGYEAVL